MVLCATADLATPVDIEEERRRHLSLITSNPNASDQNAESPRGPNDQAWCRYQGLSPAIEEGHLRFFKVRVTELQCLNQASHP